MNKTNSYIEYFHWNNNKTLDAIKDNSNNIYLINDSYLKRKQLCNYFI